jgi:hypothetical protein
MSEWLKKCQGLLKELGEIVDLLAQLGLKAKQHWRVLLIALLSAAVYGSLHWLAFEHPADTIRSYYAAIDATNSTHLDEAWNFIYPTYRKRWSNDFKSFAADYGTTVAHSDITITPSEDGFNPLALWRIFFTQTIDYEVAFVAKDSFARQDCEQPNEKRNCEWLQIRWEEKYFQLLTNRPAAEEYGEKPTLELIRFYKQTITVHRLSTFTWAISDFKHVETGIIW